MKISELKGEELSAVSFVMDFVELCFHGPIIRCLDTFLIVNGNEETIYPEKGSRDALCRLIGKKLKNAYVIDDQTCHLVTDDDTRIVIPLEETEKMPERMHFVCVEDGTMDVW